MVDPTTPILRTWFGLLGTQQSSSHFPGVLIEAVLESMVTAKRHN